MEARKIQVTSNKRNNSRTPNDTSCGKVKKRKISTVDDQPTTGVQAADLIFQLDTFLRVCEGQMEDLQMQIGGEVAEKNICYQNHFASAQRHPEQPCNIFI